MSIAADQSGPQLMPGPAQETIREMAAVIRTVFGVGLQASRRAAALAAQAEPAPAVSTPTAAGVDNVTPLPTSVPASNPIADPVAAPAAPAEQASIPMPELSAGIPVPSIPVP